MSPNPSMTFTEQSLAAALGKVQSLHDMSVELIAQCVSAEAVKSHFGHGHGRPRPDGVRMRCGGPSICSVCKAEAGVERVVAYGLMTREEAEARYGLPAKAGE